MIHATHSGSDVATRATGPHSNQFTRDSSTHSRNHSLNHPPKPTLTHLHNVIAYFYAEVQKQEADGFVAGVDGVVTVDVGGVVSRIVG